MAFDHLPDCDQEHSRRQQCNIAGPATDKAATTTVAPPASQPEVPARPRWTRGRIIAGALLAAVVTATVVGIVNGALTDDPSAASTRASIDLPEWARPIGATELRNDHDCRGDGPWLPPCRTLEFGTHRPYEDVVRELKTALEARGWSAQFEGHDLSLHAADRAAGQCMLFYQGDQRLPQTEETNQLTRFAEFAVVIGIVIDGCGAYYPS